METKVKIGKTTATLLLHVNETESWRQRTIVGRIAWFGLVLMWAILFSFQRSLSLANIAVLCILLTPLVLSFVPSRIKYFLCEEGVGVGNKFYRWDLFHSITANNEKKQFTLKTSTSSLKLISREHFDEVNRILLEHIPVKQ